MATNAQGKRIFLKKPATFPLLLLLYMPPFLYQSQAMMADDSLTNYSIPNQTAKIAGGTTHAHAEAGGFSLAIDRSRQSIAEASRDFGRLISGRADGIVAVSTPDELVETLRHANAAGLRVTPCGTHSSCGGQSLPHGGLSLDMKGMNAIGPVDVENATIECDAGATLRAVSEVTLAHGMLPNILAFNLDITVGGVLSAGGFGANCHRFGPMVANVTARRRDGSGGAQRGRRALTYPGISRTLRTKS